MADGIATSSFRNNEVIVEHYNALYAIMNKSIDNVIVEIQKEQVGNRIGQLQMKLLLETRDIVSTVHNMYLLYHDYYKQDK